MFSLLLLVSLLSTGFATNSSMKGRVNLPALHFFSRAGHHVLDEEIPKIVLPNITIPIEGGPGTGVVSALNLNITKFKSPDFEISLSEEGIFWKSRGGVVKINGDWTAEYTILIPLYENGWIEVLVNDIQVYLGAVVFTLDGKPQVKIGTCEASVGDLHLQIGGGVLPWLVNLFRKDISAAIKKEIHEQACEVSRNIVITEANKFLRSLPSHIPIGANFFVDYSLDQDPKFTNTYIDGDISADVVYGNMSCLPQRTGVWNDAGSNPRMVTLWVSESIPNCLLNSAHKGNLVEFTVTKDIPQVESYLRTSCSLLSICIGRFFPKLKQLYPKQYVDLYFHTYKAPFVEISENNGASANFSFAVDILINPRSKYPKALARLVLSASSRLVPELKGNRLIGNINETSITVLQDFSTIGNMSNAFLSMFQKVFLLTTNVIVESVLHKGVPLPILDNVTIANTSEIHFFDGYARLNVDFEYYEKAQKTYFQ